MGIATGMLILAVHIAGLVALTHTPSPMGFLNQLLGRPAQEKPFLILVVGYPDGGGLRAGYFEKIVRRGFDVRVKARVPRLDRSPVLISVS